MEEARSRVNENGRVVIPAAFRKALGIQAGDEIVMRIEDDELRLSTQQRRIRNAQRRAAQYLKPGTSLVGELLAERRRAAKHE
jgi:AbrB family looped-hinge helix DNA binding protein